MKSSDVNIFGSIVRRGYTGVAVIGGGALLIASFTAPATFASQDVKPEQRDGSVRVSMRNVKYRFIESVSVQINYLTGAFVPLGASAMPVFDEHNSFKIHIDSAEIAISPQDLASLLNQFVFARPGSPLSDISVRMLPNAHLSVK